MDGRTGRLYSSTPRKLALQLRPQPRFVAPPAAPAQAVNVIRPFVRALPLPLTAVKATPLLALPKLGAAGLAFGLGFFVGDALINPLLGREPTFDWGFWNSPDGSPDYLHQDPLPDDLSILSTGEMGTEGAFVEARADYWLSEKVSGGGCSEPVAGDRPFSHGANVEPGGGQLRYEKGVPFENNCGFDFMRVQVLLRQPDSGEEPAWRTLRTINFSNARPPRGVTQTDFEVKFEPLGDAQGFLPTPIWEPITTPKPTIEPEPQVQPQPLPQRTPLAPPLIPQAPPDVAPVPLPTPAPTIQPAPSPLPQTNPALVPNRPATPLPTLPATDTQQISNAGELVPRKPAAIQTTPTDAHFPVSGEAPVRSGGVRPSMDSIAAEVGRIEQKIARGMQKTRDIPWWIIPGILELLSGFLESDIPGTTYQLTGVCESVEPGAEQPTAEFPVEPAKNLGAIINRLDVMDDMLQQHLAWRTPTCRTRPQLEGDWRTISFISDETSPFGKSRLRKRLRYRSLSGLGLGEVIDHWANFTWTAGPVCVIHSGASWGTPQVWASSVDEGKRVIRHAAGESGLDPDQVGQWTVSGSSSARVGVSGTMRVNQTGGFYWITARDGSEGRPIVGRV